MYYCNLTLRLLPRPMQRPARLGLLPHLVLEVTLGAGERAQLLAPISHPPLLAWVQPILALAPRKPELLR